jgi:hypothetical protein
VNPPNEDPPKNAWASIARYSEIGFIIPAAVLLGFFLGFVQMIRMAATSFKDKS